MYDEFERAGTGRSTSGGMSVLGWVAAGFGFFFLVGLVGIGFAIHRAVSDVGDMAREFEVGTRLADHALLADLEAQRELVSMDPDRGLDFLRGLESGDPAEAFLGQVVRGTFAPGHFGRHAPHAPQAPEPPAPPDVPGVPNVADVADVADVPDVPAPPDAPFIVGSSDRPVRVAVERSGGHRSLVINADGEQVRFDLVRTGDGGFLTIDSDDGSVRFDLVKGDEGAQLVIRADDETVRLGVGDEAQVMPAWVPRFEGMPEQPRPIYSFEGPEGTLGAVSWSGSAGPEDILAYYRSELEAQGYDIRAEARATDEGAEQGAFWGRSETDGRVVFVVAHAEDGGTKVLLGYGEER